jgi:Flp pilus assembly protein TadB
MLDINPVQAIVAALVIIGGIAFLVWYSRRERRFAEYRREDEAKRQARRQRDMAELDPQGKLLYQLIERQDDLQEELRYQTRKLGDISTATTLIAVLLVLSVIVGCLAGVFGLSVSGLS